MSARARRPATHRRHKVTLALQAFDLTRAGTALTVMVFDGRTKLGELHVGRGSLRWFGSRDKIPTRLGWRRFDELMHDARSHRQRT